MKRMSDEDLESNAHWASRHGGNDLVREAKRARESEREWQALHATRTARMKDYMKQLDKAEWLIDDLKKEIIKLKPR